MPELARAFEEPERLYRRSEILTRPSPAPSCSGIYGWYFRSGSLPVVPTAQCVSVPGFDLCYVGIAPSEPSKKTGKTSTATLHSRIRQHLTSNASGSTLRKSLGCILAEDLGLTLAPTGRTHRMTFQEGEKTLSSWMEKNARVTWLPCEIPWIEESRLIKQLSLPLNLDQNRDHEFYPELTGLRRDAVRKARAMINAGSGPGGA